MGELQPQIGLWISTPRRGVAVVEVEGECDLYEAPRLESALAEAHAASGGDVFVDLSRLRLLDAASLRVLLKAQRTHAAKGSKLALVAPSDEVRRTLAAPGLERRFTIVDRRGVVEADTPRHEEGIVPSSAMFRSMNERILELDSAWGGNEELHLFCECPAPRCMRPVAMLREEFERIRSARGHVAVATTHGGEDAAGWAVLRRGRRYLVVAPA